MQKKSFKILAVSIAVVAALAVQAWADQEVSTSYAMPMHVKAYVDESGCDNSGGPYVTLGADIEMGGMKARVTFSNNAKGTHTATVTTCYDVDLILPGGAITIPKQPCRGGVGGNPHIYLQFTDGKGTCLSDEFYLGRCVQGVSADADVLNAAAALATVRAGDCSNKGGPTITLDGTITLGGLHALIIFRNNVKGTHTAEATSDICLIMEGSTITIPKQPCRGGAGGNPIVGVQFLDGDDGAICAPVILGRCNQL